MPTFKSRTVHSVAHKDTNIYFHTQTHIDKGCFVPTTCERACMHVCIQCTILLWNWKNLYDQLSLLLWPYNVTALSSAHTHTWRDPTHFSLNSRNHTVLANICMWWHTCIIKAICESWCNSWSASHACHWWSLGSQAKGQSLHSAGGSTGPKPTCTHNSVYFSSNTFAHVLVYKHNFLSYFSNIRLRLQGA